ncbi:MAG TPA: NnrS family protein, partial [Afifellaceae bacterium]|nr:NnrS family protein [Afifellaceae bacterium]
MAIPRLREYPGPALLSYGFRPFFLLGALYSGLSVMVWMPQFYGELQLATHFAPVDWHVHELFFGYLAAVVTGFLFTAVPNWTGRMPIQGTPLLVLLLIWIGGRFAVTFSAVLGWVPAMAVDLAFLAAIAMVIGKEIVAGRNWRNLKVLAPLLLLLAANTCFHLEVHFAGSSDYSRRLAMAAAITLIMLIGGRIIPSFTRNWLARENPGRLPISFNYFDRFSLAAGIAALAAWVIEPVGVPATTLMGLAALVHL